MGSHRSGSTGKSLRAGRQRSSLQLASHPRVLESSNGTVLRCKGPSTGRPYSNRRSNAGVLWCSCGQDGSTAENGIHWWHSLRGLFLQPPKAHRQSRIKSVALLQNIVRHWLSTVERAVRMLIITCVVVFVLQIFDEYAGGRTLIHV